MKNLEEYYLELEQKIDSCRNGRTAYSEEELQFMFHNGKILIKKVLEESSIKFDSLFIGHNTFQIRFEKNNDYHREIKNILQEWQSDKDELGYLKEKTISRFFTNGYGTAYVIPYD